MNNTPFNADKLVKLYIMRQYREYYPQSHLAICPGAVVEEAEASHALFYDSMVDGVQFTATIRCPHGQSHDYEYGELGDLPDILQDMLKEDGDPC